MRIFLIFAIIFAPSCSSNRVIDLVGEVEKDARSNFESDDDVYPVNRHIQLSKRQGNYGSVQKDFFISDIFGKITSKSKDKKTEDHVKNELLHSRCNILLVAKEYMSEKKDKLKDANLSLSDIINKNSGDDYSIKLFRSDKSLSLNLVHISGPGKPNTDDVKMEDRFTDVNGAIVFISYLFDRSGVLVNVNCDSGDAKNCSLSKTLIDYLDFSISAKCYQN